MATRQISGTRATPSRRPTRRAYHEKYRQLIEAAKALPRVTTAVAHPCDASSLTGAVDAAQMGPMKPILVGPRAKIAAVASQCTLDISPYELVDAPHSHAAAALMKGSLHLGASWITNRRATA